MASKIQDFPDPFCPAMITMLPNLSRITSLIPLKFDIVSEFIFIFHLWWCCQRLFISTPVWECSHLRFCLIDKVMYQPPFGVLGQLLHRFYIRRTLDRIFRYRKDQLHNYLSSSSSEPHPVDNLNLDQLLWLWSPLATLAPNSAWRYVKNLFMVRP